VNDRRQGEGCIFSRNTKCSLLCVNNGQVPCRRTAVLVVLRYKKYREGDGTGTVEKWYRDAAEVPWYRAALQQTAITIRCELSAVSSLIRGMVAPVQRTICKYAARLSILPTPKASQLFERIVYITTGIMRPQVNENIRRHRQFSM